MFQPHFPSFPKKPFKNSHFFLLILVTIFCYGITITFDFTNWDDQWLVLDNLFIRTLDFPTLGKMFNPFFPRNSFGGEYLPLRDLSYAIDYQLFALNPVFYHVENLLFYIGMVLGSYVFFHRFTKNREIAFIGALFYAVHPLHVESVAWISARKDMLSGFFFLISLERYVCFIQHKKGYWLSFLFFVMALLSKYTVISLPCLLVVFHIYFTKDSSLKNILRGIKKTLPFWIVSISIVFLAMYVGKTSSVILKTPTPFLHRIFTSSMVNLEYLGMLVFPANLSPVYEVYPYPWSGTVAISLFLNLLLFGKILFDFLKKQTFYSFCGIFFYICLLPVANIVPSPVVKANRYLLLPSLGYALFLGYFFSRWLQREKKLGKKWKKMGVFVLLIFYFGLTITQVQSWKNSKTLWNEVLRHNYRSIRALNNLASYYLERGEFKKGLILIKKSLKEHPENSIALHNLMILKRMQEKDLQIRPKKLK